MIASQERPASSCAVAKLRVPRPAPHQFRLIRGDGISENTPGRSSQGPGVWAGGYSPNCVEQEFYEVRLLGILGSWISALRSSKKFVTKCYIQATAKITQLSDSPAPLTGVCCLHHVLRGSKGEVAFGENSSVDCEAHER